MARIVSKIQEYLEFKGVKPATAEKLAGLSNGTLSKPFNDGKEIKTDTLEKFLLSYTDINPLWLLSGNGPMLINDLNVLAEPTEEYRVERNSEMEIIDDTLPPEEFVNGSGNRFLIYPDGRYTVEVLEVPFHAYASYAEAYADEKLMEQEFVKTTFDVEKVGLGHYMGFRVKGDSMNGGGINDTPNGAKVLGREVGRHLWNDGFRQTKYGFILLTSQNIYHKDIAGYNKDTGMLTLHSRNAKVADFEISINDVYKVFNVVKRAY